jgi:hypothetical protein
MSKEERLERLYLAVEKNLPQQVKSILEENLNSISRISARYLAGLLIIAAESNNIEVAKEFINSNHRADEKIDQKYICCALGIAGKNKALGVLNHALN